jgi:hypothetical protein
MQQHVEQFVEMPVPTSQGEVVQVPTIVPQQRIMQQHEQSECVPGYSDRVLETPKNSIPKALNRKKTGKKRGKIGNTRHSTADNMDCTANACAFLPSSAVNSVVPDGPALTADSTNSALISACEKGGNTDKAMQDKQERADRALADYFSRCSSIFKGCITNEALGISATEFYEPLVPNPINTQT